MRKQILFCLLLCCFNSFSFQYPAVALFFNVIPPSTVFYGETLRIPVQLNYGFLRTYKFWHIPPGSSLEYVSGACPAIPYDTNYFYSGICNMRLVIPGDRLNKVISGALIYEVSGKEDRHDWDWAFPTNTFNVRVIPHKLSMVSIMPQSATANIEFIYNLKSAVKYYDENIKAGTQVEINVEPQEQDGLSFDPSLAALTGKPTRTGTYVFKVKAKNNNGVTEPVTLTAEVETNLKETPVFKNIYSVATAIPGKKYHIALMNLIESQPSFGVTNQVSFRIERKVDTPDWLVLSKEDSLFLMGEVPADAGGTEVELTLIASSNAGGDSEPFILKIPIAYDSQDLDTDP